MFNVRTAANLNVWQSCRSFHMTFAVTQKNTMKYLAELSHFSPLFASIAQDKMATGELRTWLTVASVQNYCVMTKHLCDSTKVSGYCHNFEGIFRLSFPHACLWSVKVYPDRTHAGTRRMYKLHAEKPPENPPGQNPEPSYCEATVQTAAPPFLISPDP